MKSSLSALTVAGLLFGGLTFTKSRGQSMPAQQSTVSNTVSVPLPEKPEPLKVPEVQAMIRAAAEKNRVPEAFVKSIVAAESNFNTDAVSAVGAIGLMQLMPSTAQEYNADPKIPEQNVDAGTRYLHILMEKYRKCRNPLSRVIAAYNAGPGAVDRYRGVPPFRETRKYVVRVMAFLKQFQRDHRCLGNCRSTHKGDDWVRCASWQEPVKPS